MGTREFEWGRKGRPDMHCDNCGHLEAENAKLRDEVERLRYFERNVEQNERAYNESQAELKVALLQNRVVETHLHDLIESIDASHHLIRGGNRLHGHTGCEVCAVIERGSKKLKCGLAKPLGGGEACILDVGHRGPCDHALKRNDEKGCCQDEDECAELGR